MYLQKVDRFILELARGTVLAASKESASADEEVTTSCVDNHQTTHRIGSSGDGSDMAKYALQPPAVQLLRTKLMLAVYPAADGAISG